MLKLFGTITPFSLITPESSMAQRPVSTAVAGFSPVRSNVVRYVYGPAATAVAAFGTGVIHFEFGPSVAQGGIGNALEFAT